MSRPLTEDEITIAVADWIGWLAVGVAAISQIPQIIRVINIKTGEGLCVLSNCLAVLRYAIMWCYMCCNDHDYSQYMEYPLLLVQQFVLLGLILYYKKSLDIWAILGAFCVCIFTFSFVMGGVDKFYLNFVMPLCLPLSGISKYLQMLKTLSGTDSKDVSLFTWLYTTTLHFTRIHTTSVLTPNSMLYFTQGASFISCLGVLLVILVRKKQHRA